MSKHRSWRGIRDMGGLSLVLTMMVLAAIASPASAQMTGFTKIYNSGVVTLGADESLQLTIANNNNLSDPALPDLPASEKACAYVAQFLDDKGNVLQKQQQTLQPGQNFSFSVNGPQTVQARVDITPGTASGFAGEIADQCAVSNEILSTTSNEPVLFPPLGSTRVLGASSTCQSGCLDDCSNICKRGTSDRGTCLNVCKQTCRLGC